MPRTASCEAILEANAEYTIDYQIGGRVRDFCLVQEEEWSRAVEPDCGVRAWAS